MNRRKLNKGKNRKYDKKKRRNRGKKIDKNRIDGKKKKLINKIN